MRKKLSEMTPMERVDRSMKGMTWDEAEEVGIEILARCLINHIYVKGDGEAAAELLPKRVSERVCVLVEERRKAVEELKVSVRELGKAMAEFKAFMDKNGKEI